MIDAIPGNHVKPNSLPLSHNNNSLPSDMFLENNGHCLSSATAE